MVVKSNAVHHPWAVMVMPRDARIANDTVLGPHGLTRHTRCTEVQATETAFARERVNGPTQFSFGRWFGALAGHIACSKDCLLYTSPSPRD